MAYSDYLGDLVVGLQVNASSTKEAEAQVNTMAANITKTMSGLQRVVKGYLSFKGLTNLGNKFVQNTAAMQKSLGLFESAMLSTHNAAGKTVEDLSRITNSLADLSGMPIANVREGISILQSMTNIRGDMFDKAALGVVNFAMAMGRDVPQAAISLGKALQNPQKGMTSLIRLGVILTQKQKDEITSFLKVGDVVKAQGVILDEIERKYGSTAKMVGEKLPGALGRLKNAWFRTFVLEKDNEGVQAFQKSLNDLAKTLNTDLGFKAFNKSLGTLLLNIGAGAVNTINIFAKNVDFLAKTIRNFLIISAIGKVTSSIMAFTKAYKTYLAVSAANKAATAASALGLGMKVAIQEGPKAVGVIQNLAKAIASYRIAVLAGSSAVEALAIAWKAFSTAIEMSAFVKLGLVGLVLGLAAALAKVSGVLDDIIPKLNQLKDDTKTIFAGKTYAELLKTADEQDTTDKGLFRKWFGTYDSRAAKRELQKRENSMSAVANAMRARDVDYSWVSGGDENSPFDFDVPKDKGKSAIEKMVDRMKMSMKYLNTDGNVFLGTLTKLASKTQMFSKDWKVIQELIKEIKDSNWDKFLLVQEGILSRMKKQTDEAEARFKLEKEIQKTEKEIYEEQQRADKEYQSSIDERYSLGLMSRNEYLKTLQKEFDASMEKLKELGNTDYANWDEPTKQRFQSILGVQSQMASKELSRLDEQFNNGKITIVDYNNTINALIEKYKDYGTIVQDLVDAQEQMNYQFTKSRETVLSFSEMTLRDLNDALWELPDAFAEAAANAAIFGDSMSETLKNLGKEIAALALKYFILKTLFGGAGGGSGPLMGLFSGFFGGGGSGYSAATSSLAGAYGRNFGFADFAMAKGGVFDKPQYFMAKGGLGVFAEAGAEAIMPLSKNSKGELGVKTTDSSGAGNDMFVVNIQAVDAPSFVALARNNKNVFENIIVESIGKNSAIRKAIKQTR